MFNFLHKSKTPEKYDDVDWHEDAPDGKAAHIALMFIWLASRNHIKDHDELQKLSEALGDRTKKPSEVLDEYADGKILSSMVDAETIDFLNEFYETTFLSTIENNDKIALDRTSNKPPYDIDDTWENVDKTTAWLDSQYEVWLSSNKG